MKLAMKLEQHENHLSEMVEAVSDRPKISVCIGAYNRASYIRECIDSVMNQTRPADEIIVVDDASTDGTLAILETYGDKIQLIKRDHNSGICPITRNQAARAATGDFIAFLDSDDVWYPEKLERQAAFMEQHPEIVLSHTMCDVIDENSRRLHTRHSKEVIPPTGMIFRPLLEHCWITISMAMVRREIFDSVGWFNADPPYGYLGEDQEFFLRVARKYPIGFIPDVLGGFRKAGQGITAKNWKAIPTAVPLFQAFLKRRDIWEGQVERSVMVKALTDKCDQNAYFHRQQGSWQRVAWFARQALAADWTDVRAWRHWMASLFRRGA